MKEEMLFLDEASEICSIDYGIVLPESALLQAVKAANIKIMLSNGRKYISRAKFNELMPEYFRLNQEKYSYRRRNISLGTKRFYKIQRIIYSFLEIIIRDVKFLNALTAMINMGIKQEFKALSMQEVNDFVYSIKRRQEQREDRGSLRGSRFTVPGLTYDREDYIERDMTPTELIENAEFKPLELEGSLTVETTLNAKELKEPRKPRKLTLVALQKQAEDLEKQTTALKELQVKVDAEIKATAQKQLSAAESAKAKADDKAQAAATAMATPSPVSPS